ncbi:unnamed protein product [Peniophora sp. CBMAI 1063]|nr:unnamed protein product [Peniophora sp. CBMAI 1063]
MADTQDYIPLHWPQCSLQAINLTPFILPVNIWVYPNSLDASQMNLATGYTESFFNWTVPFSIAAGTHFTLYIEELKGQNYSFSGNDIASPVSDHSGDPTCSHPDPGKAIAIRDSDSSGVSWPICSTQFVDLTGFRQPVNLSISVDDGTSISSLATNLTAKVYPIDVKWWHQGEQVQLHVDQQADDQGIPDPRVYSRIEVGESNDSSCLPSSVTASSPTSSSTVAPAHSSSGATASRNGTSTAAIAGGAAGGVAALAITLALVLFCIWRRRQTVRSQAVEIEPGIREAYEETPGYLPSYAEISSPTPLTGSVSYGDAVSPSFRDSVSESERSRTPLGGSSSPSASRSSGGVKTSVSSSASYLHHARTDSKTPLLYPNYSPSAFVLHNPDVTEDGVLSAGPSRTYRAS